MAKSSDKFHKGSLVRTRALSIPDVILKDIQSRGWEYRWLNAKRLTEAGGYDQRGFIAYRIPDSLRKPLAPGEYGEDYQMSIDGFYHRGDLILGVMPKIKADARRAAIEKQNQEEIDIRRRVKSTFRGVSVEAADRKVGSLQPNINDILEK